MSRFDRTIPPGGEGKIILQVKTAHYQGKISRGAKIYSNDPSGKPETISIGVFVRVSIRVSPNAINFLGAAGDSITKTVTIRAGSGKPLTLEPIAFDLDKFVTYKLEPIKEGESYKLVFTNIPGPAETYRGFIRLKTNYSEKPLITIPIRGKFKDKTSN